VHGCICGVGLPTRKRLTGVERKRALRASEPILDSVLEIGRGLVLGPHDTVPLFFVLSASIIASFLGRHMRYVRLSESPSKENVILKHQILAVPLQTPQPENAAFQLGFIDVLHEGAIITDLAGCIVRSNDAAFDVFGYRPLELAGKAITTLSALGETIFIAGLLRSVTESGVCRTELQQRSKAGKVLQVQLTLSVMRDAVENPCGLLWLYVDVTPTKTAKLQEDERFEVLTQALPQLISWADQNGNTINATSRTLDFFGVPLKRLTGRRWANFVHPEDRVEALEKWNKAVAEGKIFEVEYRLRRHDGEDVYHLARALPILDATGTLTGYVQTCTDMSSQKRTESALRQSEKLAAVGKLASSLSHEINNPLESVTNLLYLLGSNPTLDRSGLEYLRMAEAELARISEITTQTLRFHRQATKAVPTRLAEVIDSVLSIYKSRITSAGLRLSREYESTEPLTCFAGEIRQAIANVIGNAIDATSHGGKLRVRLRTSHDWKTRQQLGLRITVGETGSGITREQRAHIFEAFFTTKGISGTGLGLWITKGLIDKHHGAISIHSSTEEHASGTVVSIFLPFETLHRPAFAGLN
jgi:PAS domain S-box-containing protein